MIDYTEGHFSETAFAHLLGRIYDTPLMVLPSRLDQIAAVVLARVQIDALRGANPAPPPTRTEGKPYPIRNGVAILSTTGTLVHRGSYVKGDSGGMQGYTGLSRRRQMAQDDPDVQKILYEFDTPGGEVSGAFEYAEELYNDRASGKPQAAVVSDMAASAGYLLASAVGDVLVSPTSQAAGVGVVMKHLDRSKMNERIGVTPTYIYAGKHKIDGNPDAPLPDSVKAEWESHANHIYELFVDAVSKYRGMSTDKVRGTEAKIFVGEEAILEGFADGVSTPAAMLQSMGARQEQAAAPLFTLGPSWE